VISLKDIFLSLNTKKKMERNTKKVRDVIQSKFFPSDNELAELAEAHRWNDLEEALGKRSVLSAVQQVVDRGGGYEGDRDALREIMLNSDIRDVLSVSVQAPIVAGFLEDPVFWKRKLLIDMPELFAKNALNESILDKLQTNISNFEKFPTKNIYFVLRYFVNAAKRIIWYNTIMEQEHSITENVQNEYVWENGEIYVQTLVENRGKVQYLGKKTVVPFKEFYTFFYPNRVYLQYLYNFSATFNPPSLTMRMRGIAFDRDERRVRTMFLYERKHNERGELPYVTSFNRGAENLAGTAAYRDTAYKEIAEENFSVFRSAFTTFHNDSTRTIQTMRIEQFEKDREEKYFPDRKAIFGRVYQEYVTFRDLLERGWVKKDEQGRKFIGCYQCDNCFVEFKLECCPDIQYCSRMCAEKDWETHRIRTCKK